jgi:hypothetical protein
MEKFARSVTIGLAAPYIGGDSHNPWDQADECEWSNTHSPCFDEEIARLASQSMILFESTSTH